MLLCSWVIRAFIKFLLHTYRASEMYGIDPREILMELGRRKMVGGQEDMIISVAYELSQQREVAKNGARLR